jgi:uncharacterized protein
MTRTLESVPSAGTLPPSWASVATASTIALTTYKKDGTAVTTPMWAALDGGRILTSADNTAWKLRRLARNPSVKLAPCTARGKVKGTFVDGYAYVLDEAGTAASVAAKRNKYAMFRIMQLLRIRKPQIGIVIVPTAAAPVDAAPADAAAADVTKGRS